MTRKGAHIRIPQQAEEALAVLEAAGAEAWVVGGFVRDSLMGRDPGDLDIASSARWEETARAFRGAGFPVYETGTKHGTVTVDIGGCPIEVTTYRTDGCYSDGRHPDSVSFVDSIEEDLARRDFTMNAIAYHPDRGVCDPYGGKEDIQRGLIRCVGDPERRFGEDALRILRAARFASQTGFAIDPATKEAMDSLADGLLRVAAERQKAELDKLLCGPHAGDCILSCTKAIGAAVPELAEMEGFDQKTPFHCYDVLEHTARVVDLVEPQPLLRWAALLHDVGKPETFTVDDAGQGHFKGHPEASARIARTIAQRLRFPRGLRQDMLCLVALHDEPVMPDSPGVRRALHALGDRPEMLRALISLKRADATARTKLYGAPRVRTANLLSQILEETLQNGEPYALRHLAITGRDLIDAGISPGPQVGTLLEDCLQAVIGGHVANDARELVAFALETGRSDR